MSTLAGPFSRVRRIKVAELTPRAFRTDPAAPDGPDEFRTILDALDEEDRRDEPTDPTAGHDPTQQATLRPPR